MSNKLAVDFGTSNTLFALWDETRRDSIPLHIPDYANNSSQWNSQFSSIPSLIHYSTDNRQWIGQQVQAQGLSSSRRTFRWMKRYIIHRSPMSLKLGDRTISPRVAGKDYLSTLLTVALAQLNSPDAEVGFSVPVEAFEHYQNWLTEIAEWAGIKRYRFIDEPSAAALGYDASIQPEHAYLIFDMGGGTMHASVVLVEDTPEQLSGRRCRVLGKSGRDLGGATIDQWLFEEILNEYQFKDYDPAIREISNQLLLLCEEAKQRLSYEKAAEITFSTQKDPNQAISKKITRSEFEEVLENHNLFTEINFCIQTALSLAKERGYSQETISSVFMVGGASQIPSVQRSLRQIFGKERVHCSRPLDAVVRGTAAFIGGVDFFDHIQHDYAIRHVNSITGQYDFRTVVPRGTRYPSADPVAEMTIKATHTGQQFLGVLIYEIGETQRTPAQSLELIFDPSGSARLMQITPEEIEDRSRFFMNEEQPTFLEANPPAEKGQSRFNVEFHIDANKRLTITARDILTGKLILDRYPVVKLV